MANIRTFYANAYEVTLTAELAPTDLELAVTTTDGAPSAPFYIQVDPESATQREYMLVSTVGASTLTVASIGDRYLAGSAVGSGLTHVVGTTVKVGPVEQMFTDIHDRIESRLSTSAHTTSIHNNLGILHSSLSGLGDDDHTQYLNIARHDTTSRHGSSVVDHGSIGGLGDDDHTQYLRTDGSRTATGNLYAPNFRAETASLATTGTVALDLAGAMYKLQGPLTGDVTYTTSNRALGRSVTVFVENDSTERTVTFPAAWRFVGVRPETIEANMLGVLTIVSRGTADSDVIAAWGVSE